MTRANVGRYYVEMMNENVGFANNRKEAEEMAKRLSKENKNTGVHVVRVKELFDVTYATYMNGKED